MKATSQFGDKWNLVFANKTILYNDRAISLNRWSLEESQYLQKKQGYEKNSLIQRSRKF